MNKADFDDVTRFEPHTEPREKHLRTGQPVREYRELGGARRYFQVDAATRRYRHTVAEDDTQFGDDWYLLDD